jgi:RNA polymerase sigma-70 factor (ECF subfamily)
LKHERVKEAEEDRALVRKAREGDTDAFRRLVERHQRRAFALAVGLVRDESDARELVQEAFIRVYRSLDGFEGGSSFFTWLYRIITNLSIDLLRKPGRQAVDLDEERLAAGAGSAEDAAPPLMSTYDGADPVDAIRRREIAERLQAALDALPPYHRAVVVLRELEGLSYEEMAQALGVSKGTVMSRLFHARQKLQRALADCYEEQVGRDRRGVRSPAGAGDERDESEQSDQRDERVGSDANDDGETQEVES